MVKAPLITLCIALLFFCFANLHCPFVADGAIAVSDLQTDPQLQQQQNAKDNTNKGRNEDDPDDFGNMNVASEEVQREVEFATQLALAISRHLTNRPTTPTITGETSKSTPYRITATSMMQPTTTPNNNPHRKGPQQNFEFNMLNIFGISFIVVFVIGIFVLLYVRPKKEDIDKRHNGGPSV